MVFQAVQQELPDQLLLSEFLRIAVLVVVVWEQELVSLRRCQSLEKTMSALQNVIAASTQNSPSARLLSARPRRFNADSCLWRSRSSFSERSLRDLAFRDFRVALRVVISSSEPSRLSGSAEFTAGDGDREPVRCRLTIVWFLQFHMLGRRGTEQRSITHSSLSLRPRFAGLPEPSSDSPMFSLLASIALRSCSSS